MSAEGRPTPYQDPGEEAHAPGDAGGRGDLLPYQPASGQEQELARVARWVGMTDEERHRRAAAACQNHDAAALLDLLDAHLTLRGRSGAKVSDHTRAAYRHAAGRLLADWMGENLARPGRDAGTLWVRRLETEGLAPSSCQVALSAARTLYRALRWARATEADPFADAKAAPDTTDAADKRSPYSQEDLARMLAVATPAEAVLILLGAHAGLRVSEALAVRWTDVRFAESRMTVRHGKGGRARQVVLSQSLATALTTLRLAVGAAAPGPGECDQNAEGAEARQEARPEACVLPYKERSTAWRHIAAVCRRAGVRQRGVHALRHSAGTRLFRETGNLEAVARHLSHRDIATSRVYIEWADTTLERTVGIW